MLTDDGQVLNGIVLDQDDRQIRLVTSDRRETVLDRDEIEESRPGHVSVMPSGLDQQLTTDELSDLLSFLEAAK